MFNLISLPIIILILMIKTSYSGDLTDNEQNEFYKNCNSTCYKSQLSMKGNEMFLSTPFVLEAYCSCYCFKMATKSSRSEANLMAKYAATGKSAEIQKLPSVMKASDLCLNMIVED